MRYQKCALLCLLSIVLVAAGCKPAPTPVPTATPLPAPTGVFVQYEPGTPVPEAAATLSYDIVPLMGQWLLDFTFDFTGGTVIDQTTFGMSFGFWVDASGKFSGQGEMSVTASNPECDVHVVEGDVFNVNIEGYVEHVDEEGQGAETFFVVELVPEDGMLMQHYEMYCPSEFIAYKSQLLWEGLRQAEAKSFRIPAVLGTRQTFSYEVTSATQDYMNYRMESTVYVGR